MAKSTTTSRSVIDGPTVGQEDVDEVNDFEKDDTTVGTTTEEVGVEPKQV